MYRLASILFIAAFSGDAFAANINIGPNGCTLADAITAANVNAPVGNCAAGSGSDFLIAPDGWVVTLTSDLPNIVSDMTIRSASPAEAFSSRHKQRRVSDHRATRKSLASVQVGGAEATAGQKGPAFELTMQPCALSTRWSSRTRQSTHMPTGFM